MILGNVISHKSLRKCVYLVDISWSGDVQMISQDPTYDPRKDIVYYQRYHHDINTGLITPDGWYCDQYGEPRNLEDNPASPTTILLVSRLLDESVDSKQIFQALKDEGYQVEGNSIVRNYLGRWKWKTADGEVHSMSDLILKIEREKPESASGLGRMRKIH